MLKITKHGIILTKTANQFENEGVINPAVIKIGSTVHLFYRAVKKKNYSSIGYAKLKGPLQIIERANNPIIEPEYDFEKHGTEDPRIVWFPADKLYYLFYIAYDGQNARGALATSKDLKKFTKQGLITPSINYAQAAKYFGHKILDNKYYWFAKHYKHLKGSKTMLWEKDLFILPRKINGHYALIHRILPSIQIMYFDKFSQLKNLNFWKDYLHHLSDYEILRPQYDHENRSIGAGAPFIDLPQGFLVIYHAVEDTSDGKVYHAAAALLHKKDPTKVIGKLTRPLLSPKAKWEISGDVNNVIFPTGTAIFGKKLYIYYGAADSKIAVASLNYQDLLKELTS
jgi:predicted GH43/DUF377 family glycosyl hydrolase